MAESLLSRIGGAISNFFNPDPNPKIRERIYEGSEEKPKQKVAVESTDVDSFIRENNKAWTDIMNVQMPENKVEPLVPSQVSAAPTPAASTEALPDAMRPQEPEGAPDYGDVLSTYEDSIGKPATGISPSDMLEFPEYTEGPSVNESESLDKDLEAGLSDPKGFASHASKQTATQSMITEVKKRENPREKGLTRTASGEELFMPFESLEGTGSDKANSIYEIGYGTKIVKKWLSDNREDWPEVDGVKVDVRKGITRQQAESMVQQSLSGAFKAAKRKVSKWDNLTEMQKKYWVDLAYNGGNNVFERNPNAMRKAKEGLSVESMIRTFDYIGAGGKVQRGLLNRRLSMYNEAALEITGAPVVEEYIFGPTIKVKFATKLLTDQVSKAFADKINNNGGWLVVSKGGSETKSRKVGDNFKFEG